MVCQKGLKFYTRVVSWVSSWQSALNLSGSTIWCSRLKKFVKICAGIHKLQFFPCFDNISLINLNDRAEYKTVFLNLYYISARRYQFKAIWALRRASFSSILIRFPRFFRFAMNQKHEHFLASVNDRTAAYLVKHINIKNSKLLALCMVLGFIGFHAFLHLKYGWKISNHNCVR